MIKLSTFKFGGKDLGVSYLNTESVKEGVECDIYSFSGDSSKDLAIVRVKAGCKTPLQKILSGESTLEGYLEGEGSLTLKTESDETKVHIFEPGSISLPIEVRIGDTMRWKATSDSELTFYEICTPPYEKGRFENL